MSIRLIKVRLLSRCLRPLQKLAMGLGLLCLLLCFHFIDAAQGAPEAARKPLGTGSFSPAVPRVLLGSEVLAQERFKPLLGKRIGLFTNRSGVNHNGTSTIDLLRQAKGVRLVALFAAEHGLGGNIPAGQEYPNSIHAATGLPIYSLYGPGPIRKPTAAMLKDLDAMVYDLQDTGCRSYTFISTMGLTMEACAQAGVEFIVLDRPNPAGGVRVEGPMLNPRLRSLVGQWNIPYVYGLTCGELARMINGEGWIAKRCKLSIIRMRGWRRDMAWRNTGLAWVPTSPKIPRGDSPLYYVSTGILGAIGGVNIGFNFDIPFECITASWLDMRQLSYQLNRYGLPGVKFRPYSTNNNQVCYNGVRIEFTDPARAPLMAINFYALEAIKKTARRDLFAEAIKVRRNFEMFDKVNGTEATRKDLAGGRSAAAIVKSWKPGEAAFRKQRLMYLLY